MKKLLNLGKVLSRISSGCVVCIALIVCGCGGNPSVPPATLSSIVINPDPVFIGAGTTLGLTAKGIYSDRTAVDFTSRVIWVTANPSVASVSAGGVLAAVSVVGTTTVMASWSGVTSHAVSVTITSATSTPTKDLGTGRYDHTATLLPNGKVLVTGGYDAGGALNSSELYDPNAGTNGMWSPSGPLITKRGDHTTVLLKNGLVLAVGGVDGIGGIFSNNPTSTELYDPVTGSWTSTSSLITGRAYHSMTLLADGKVLVVGGDNPAKGNLDSAEIYDPATPAALSWTAAGNLTTARYSHTATLLQDGRVLVVGGFNLLPGQSVGAVLSSAEIYDPVTGWSATGSLVKGRYAHTATLLIDGTVLVAGGGDAAGNDVATAEIYHPTGPYAGTWTSTGSLGVARYNHLAMLMPSGQVLVTGGSSLVDAFLSSAELYDPLAGTWSGTANLQTGRVVFTATLLAHGNPATDGKVLIVGGDGTAGTLSSVELHE